MENHTKVTVLGSGTIVPRLDRTAASILIESGADKIVIDTGPGTMRRLQEAGVALSDVTHLLYTHLHPDHTAELVPFLFASKYPEENARTKPLHIVAGRGFNWFFQKLEEAYGHWIILNPGQVHIREMSNLKPDETELGEMVLRTCPADHNPESVCFRLEFPDGKSLVYSGDTDVSENLVNMAVGADLFFCECSMPNEQKIPGHCTPKDAARMARRANVKHLVLTHMYPECDAVDVKKQARDWFDGKITRAEDGLELAGAW